MDKTLSIQIKELENGVNLCLDNAEQYIKDAELLRKNSSFGHAYALGVLAYEELGKAVMCDFGILLCWFINKDAITLNGKKWRNRRQNPFTRHLTKQRLQKIIDELCRAISILFGIEELEMKELQKEDVKEFFVFIQPLILMVDNIETFKLISQSLKKIVEGDLQDLLEKRDVGRIMKDFTLEEDKWRGLYVDIDWEEGKFTSPKMIKEDDASRYLSDVRESFKNARELNIGILELGHHDALIDKFVKFINMIVEDGYSNKGGI